jgi:uncharacterized protein (TIGR03000 family)
MSRRPLGLTVVLLGAVVLLWSGPAQSQEKDAKKPAYVKVLMPQADASLKIDETLTKQQGMTRNFVTPPLEPGKKYSYTLTAKWEPNNYTKITRVREVPIVAGQETVADLTKADEKKPDDIVIRYVPTPWEVVEAMCKLGTVKKGDVVYDLGCGDGRIVVTAVEKFGAKRGVGVDIDPERIKDSKKTAKDHKVEDKVEFRMADVLKIDDYGDANVVMLYMGNDLNNALRPILRKVLKPGSRIVSHRFIMGDWKPDKSITVTDASGEEFKLHLWNIGEKKDDAKEDKKKDKKDDEEWSSA